MAVDPHVELSRQRSAAPPVGMSADNATHSDCIHTVSNAGVAVTPCRNSGALAIQLRRQVQYHLLQDLGIFREMFWVDGHVSKFSTSVLT